MESRSLLLVAVVVACASACNVLKCPVPDVPDDCPCGYENVLVNKTGCCLTYECHPPAEPLECPAPPSSESLGCLCGQKVGMIVQPQPLRGLCCPTYGCVNDPTVSFCDCQPDCPDPATIDCPCGGYELKIVKEANPFKKRCCPSYKCVKTDKVAWITYSENVCEKESEFHAKPEAEGGCGGLCYKKAVRTNRVQPGKGVCCPEYKCVDVRGGKTCCSPEKIAKCPTAEETCPCASTTPVLWREADIDKGICCPQYQCQPIPGVVDTCEPTECGPRKRAKLVKAANPTRGQCCPKYKCKTKKN